VANNKQYNVNTTSAVATSTTAKTIVAVVNGSTTDLTLIGVEFSADFGTITAGSYLVELVSFNQAGAGTSTSETVNKVGGTGNTSRVSSVQRNYSAEPTTGTVLNSWYIPAGGRELQLLPLGREYAIPASITLGLRVTAPSGTPNVRATLTWEE